MLTTARSNSDGRNRLFILRSGYDVRASFTVPRLVYVIFPVDVAPTIPRLFDAAIQDPIDPRNIITDTIVDQKRQGRNVSAFNTLLRGPNIIRSDSLTVGEDGSLDPEPPEQRRS